MLLSPCAWTQWPADRPRPTEQQIADAYARYRADCDKWIAEGDTSDFNCGLDFAMAAYNRVCWWHFFFPEEKLVFNFDLAK